MNSDRFLLLGFALAIIEGGILLELFSVEIESAAPTAHLIAYHRIQDYMLPGDDVSLLRALASRRSRG